MLPVDGALKPYLTPAPYYTMGQPLMSDNSINVDIRLFSRHKAISVQTQMLNTKLGDNPIVHICNRMFSK